MSAQLRVIWEDEAEQETTEASYRPPPMPLSPAWTLAQFLEEWFIPRVVGKRCLDTQNKYRFAVRHFLHLMGPLRIDRIDSPALTEFAELLKTATYRRGLMGVDRPLALITQAGILRDVRTVVRRLGRHTDDRRASAGVLAINPYVEISPPDLPLKPAFTWEESRRIVSVATATEGRFCRLPAATWRALYAVQFFTGCRAEEMTLLRWSMLVQRGAQWWLEVPAAVRKGRKKSAWYCCHAQLASALQALLPPLFRAAEQDSPIFDFRGHCWWTLSRAQHVIHAAAGVGKNDPWHSWRRTHAEQLAKLGAAAGHAAAQGALGHGSLQITLGSYLDLHNQLRPQLPPLW